MGDRQVMQCDQCDGTGLGPCYTCGDTFEACDCEDNDSVECDACDGTGEVTTDDDEV